MACWWLVVPLWVWHGAARVLSKEVFRKLMEHRRWINKMKIRWLKSSFEARCGQSLKWKTSEWVFFGKTIFSFSETLFRNILANSFCGRKFKSSTLHCTLRCPVLMPFFLRSFFHLANGLIVKDDGTHGTSAVQPGPANTKKKPQVFEMTRKNHEKTKMGRHEFPFWTAKPALYAVRLWPT